MTDASDRVICVAVPGGSEDLVYEASQILINEINSVVGPVASIKTEHRETGAKGEFIVVGTVILAAVSKEIAKKIADVLIDYARRNPKYEVKVENLKITKDYASFDEVKAINDLVEKLCVGKTNESV